MVLKQCLDFVGICSELLPSRAIEKRGKCTVVGLQTGVRKDLVSGESLRLTANKVTFFRVVKLEASDETPAKRVASWLVKLLLFNVSLRLI